MSNVNTYKQPQKDSGEWLAYLLKNGELVLLNLFTNKKQHFTSVTDYSFNDQGNVLLLKTSITRDSIQKETLLWINLKENMTTSIWNSNDTDENSQIGDYTFDLGGSKLAFTVQQQLNDRKQSTIWYYQTGTDKSVMIASNQSVGIEFGMAISNQGLKFSPSGDYVFFYLIPAKDRRQPNSDAPKVDVWNYRDSVLQSTQLLTGTIYVPPIEIAAVINPIDKKINYLVRENENLVATSSPKGDYVIVANKKNITEYWWRTYPQKKTFLVSLKDGSKKLLDSGYNYLNYSFSPGGNYLVYYDSKEKAYFSYALLSGQTVNISKKIPTPLGPTRASDSLFGIVQLPVGIAAWLSDDKALLIYDNYDVWKIDPLGVAPPTNVTNSYGKTNGIKLRLVVDGTTNYSENDNLLLSAFDVTNKYNGFYRKKLGTKGDPELLSMGPYYIYTVASQNANLSNAKLLKAKGANKWIVTRQSAMDAPNFFFTTDHKNYKKLTNIEPEKNYNWLTAELITWKQLDGTTSQGVLYKPENFNRHKKYPIIFKYYEELSERMYEHPIPSFTGTDINIPWFVSRGYLVFTPDIHYIIGRTGESVYNSVVSAAQYLSELDWVDKSKMGINGHSFGGYETNYLVTHTQMFAAAVSGAGVSNLISHYGGLQGRWLGSASGQGMYESSQMRLRYTLWQRPDLYITNSPIFKLNEVTTPLLLMHNKGDELVPWMQSVELFSGLRRLGKKVWLLQYDEGTHGLGLKESVDYTIRITQFFDHYLKNALPPKWMTEGIPASLKGIEMGYDLDTNDKTL